MKKIKWLAMGLALTLLAGCGTPEAKESGTNETPSAAPSGDVAGEQGKDLTYEALGVARDYPIATINGENIPAEEYLFWLTMERMYYGTPSTEEDWKAFKDVSLEIATLYQLVREKAAENGVTLTEELRAEMEADMAENLESAGEEDLEEFLSYMRISEEGYMRMNEATYLRKALVEKMVEDGSLTVAQADVDAYVDEWIEYSGFYGAKHILIMTRREKADGTGYEEFSDEEKAEAYAKAEEILAEIRADGNSPETFDRLMNQHSEDGRNPETGELYSPEGYTLAYKGEMVPEFEEAALALKEGEVSDIVTSDYGYHIIMRIPIDREALEEEAAGVVNADYKFNELLDQWVDEAQIETSQVYDELDAEAYFEKVDALYAAEQAAKESAQPTESEQPEPSPEG